MRNPTGNVTILRSWTEGDFIHHEDDATSSGTTTWRHWSSQRDRCWACDQRPPRVADRTKQVAR